MGRGDTVLKVAVQESVANPLLEQRRRIADIDNPDDPLEPSPHSESQPERGDDSEAAVAADRQSKQLDVLVP